MSKNEIQLNLPESVLKPATIDLVQYTDDRKYLVKLAALAIDAALCAGADLSSLNRMFRSKLVNRRGLRIYDHFETPMTRVPVVERPRKIGESILDDEDNDEV